MELHSHSRNDISALMTANKTFHSGNSSIVESSTWIEENCWDRTSQYKPNYGLARLEILSSTLPIFFSTFRPFFSRIKPKQKHFSDVAGNIFEAEILNFEHGPKQMLTSFVLGHSMHSTPIDQHLLRITNSKAFVEVSHFATCRKPKKKICRSVMNR